MSKVKIDFGYENNTVILENVISNELITTNRLEFPENWKLEIPKINLDAKIVEGTTDEILNKYIGHFEETGVLNGNIALAAHNRGYDVNYFERLKELNIEDKVYYTYGDIKKEYVVYSKEIIKDTNVEVLDEYQDGKNILTLITCVENMPELRRCIRCIEINNEIKKD